MDYQQSAIQGLRNNQKQTHWDYSSANALRTGRIEAKGIKSKVTV